jgi:hypothetical protein
MADEPLFLRSKAIVEPLVDRFYAWFHTVAPVQASMNLAFLQVPMLESYLQSPQVHIAASPRAFGCSECAAIRETWSPTRRKKPPCSSGRDASHLSSAWRIMSRILPAGGV